MTPMSTDREVPYNSMKSEMGTATVLSGFVSIGMPPCRSMVPMISSSMRPSLNFCPIGSSPANRESTTLAPITATRVAAVTSASVYPRPPAMERLVSVKNSGVPPATCTPRSVLPFSVAVLPYSPVYAPTCFACGSSSLTWRMCESVIFLRAWISGEKFPNCTAGQRWIWKTFAPSSPSCLPMDFRSPFRRLIIATTVKTPMMMPSSVSPERSLCEARESSASPRSSRRATYARRTRPANAGASTGGAWSATSLIPQRLDGLQQCRLQRRPQPEAHTEHGGADHAAHHHPRIHFRRQGRDEIDDRRRSRRERDSHDAAHDRHHHRLTEELPKDGGPAGADGPADADLPRPLLHRDEQDFHDPDARHDGGDDAYQDAGDVGGQHHLVEAFEQLVLPVDGEVLLLIRRQVPGVAHHRGHLVLRLPDLSFRDNHR